jgi:biotin transporter BioY
MQFKAKFLELLEKSTIPQAYITMAVVTTCCVLWGFGQPVPEGLQTALIVVIGFFFGTKAASISQKGP